MTPQPVAEPADEPRAVLVATCRCGGRIWRLTLDSARWRHDDRTPSPARHPPHRSTTS